MSFESVDDALKKLIPYVHEPSNPLWDSGLLFISRDAKDQFQVELTGFYYESLEVKKTLRPVEKELEIQLDQIHKDVFFFLQEHFSKVNPKVKWDRLVLEVKPDGRFIPHYEFDGDEVSPDAPALPETMTAAYIAENLYNCLKHNAPPDFKWVWEELSRERTEDGKEKIGGSFHYSLHPDKTDPKFLEPGEYVYMYNVSEKLFDEFFSEQTKNWSKIILEFNNVGSTYFRVLERNFDIVS
jgi:hypothetical protein